MPAKGLTPAEIAAASAAVVAAGGKSTDRANRLPGETATEANARITAAYKAQPQPELTKEGRAAGATIEWVRTGAGGVGEYKEVFPIGAPIPQTRTTEYGNIYDAQGNLVQGTGLKTGVPGTSTAQRTPEQIAAYDNAKATAQMFVDMYGGQLSNYFDAVTGRVKAPAANTPLKQTSSSSTSTGGKKEIRRTQNADGSITISYSDGTSITVGSPSNNNSVNTSTTGTSALTTTAANAAGRAERQSAYDLLFQQFNQYGLGSLVEPLRGLITSGASPAEFTIRLRESDAYKKRFAANAARVAKGLTAISEAEYIGLEDQYQNIMRNYGLPANYYTRGDMGRQEGFEKFISNDVSAAELEDRIMTAQNRVMNANPEVVASLRQFYPDISNGDILAYALDPDKGLSEIKRKVTAAEIGGGALQAGLGITGARAEELGAAGVTKQQAQQGFQTVAEVFPRGGQLAAIYGESPYTQQTAEQEVFGLAGSTEAAKQRRKLVGLEKAAFSGQSGTAQGALGRERAGNL